MYDAEAEYYNEAIESTKSFRVRHEAEGDTHGWLKLDPQFSNLLNSGNMSAENGNIVLEIVCHFHVTQTDAKPACSTFRRPHSHASVLPAAGRSNNAVSNVAPAQNS